MKILTERINDYIQINSKNKSNKINKESNIKKADKVEISKEAKDLINNESELDKQMGDKVKKIFGLKRSIENTDYNVDLEKLADKILEDFGILV